MSMSQFDDLQKLIIVTEFIDFNTLINLIQQQFEMLDSTNICYQCINKTLCYENDGKLKNENYIQLHIFYYLIEFISDFRVKSGLSQGLNLGTAYNYYVYDDILCILLFYSDV